MNRHPLIYKCRHHNKQDQAYFVIIEAAQLLCNLISILTLGYYTSRMFEKLLFEYEDGRHFFSVLRTKFKLTRKSCPEA